MNDTDKGEPIYKSDEWFAVWELEEGECFRGVQIQPQPDGTYTIAVETDQRLIQVIVKSDSPPVFDPEKAGWFNPDTVIQSYEEADKMLVELTFGGEEGVIFPGTLVPINPFTQKHIDERKAKETKAG